MGDRYTIGRIPCAHCRKNNEDLSYAESCDDVSFVCKHCGKKNDIVISFVAIPHNET